MNKDNEIRKDFTTIPESTENNTSPFLYSFFKGLKNVLDSNPIDKSEETYLLKLEKKDTKFFSKSTYQKTSKYNGYNKIAIALPILSLG